METELSLHYLPDKLFGIIEMQIQNEKSIPMVDHGERNKNINTNYTAPK